MRFLLTALSLFTLHHSLFAAAGGAIRPLAQDHVTLMSSPNPAKIPLYNPTIIALPDRRLVAAAIVSTKYAKPENPGMNIYTSDDHGLTWQHRTSISNIGQSRLLLANNTLYLLGTSGLRISKSTDRGNTWSTPVSLSKGVWHQSATNFIRAKGNIYLAIEKNIDREISTWSVGDLSPIVMRAKETDDLTNPKSWTFSQDYPFKNIIPGYRENNMPIDYFGVPFYPQNFPDRYVITTTPKTITSAPLGWLEANIAQITAPDHYWYDPAGKTFHILMRANTNGTGYAALAKAVENDDGTITTTLETVPSGKKILFLPMPGGQMRFHISYDEKTKLYWLLGTQATDSMTRAEKLSPLRFGAAENERQRLVLHFSKNLVDWCFAGLVTTGNSPKEARHYASMDIDGDDLVILSRSGDAQAKSAHDGNLITFHRVQNFRDLIY